MPSSVEVPVKFRSFKGVPGRDVARETLIDTLRDLAVLGALFLLVVFLSQVWSVVEVVGPWLFFVAAVAALLQFLSTSLRGLAESVLDGVREGQVEASAWMILATLVRLTELAVIFWMVLFLFRRAGGPV